jgi:hypothetical protein
MEINTEFMPQDFDDVRAEPIFFGLPEEAKTWDDEKIMEELKNLFQLAEASKAVIADASLVVEAKEGVEADASVDQVIKNIAQMTDDNDHTGAVLALANLLKNEQWIKVLSCITEIQDELGHMPHKLGEFRDEIRKELIEQAKVEFGEDVANKINSSF